MFTWPQSLGHRACLLGAGLVGVLLAPGDGRGVAPPHVPDEQLARYPVIVVGRWNGAPMRPHLRLEPHPDLGQVCSASETHTELIVERVIKGDIAPGTYRMLLGFRIGWLRSDGGPVMAYWSSEQIGDVEEVTEPNLWLLVWQRSWDESDPETYLGLETHRGVQPLSREAYFRALADTPTQPPAGRNSPAWLWEVGVGAVILGGVLLVK